MAAANGPSDKLPALEVTGDDIAAYASTMRRRTEESIELMTKLFTSAGRLQASQTEIAQRLSTECEKRISAEEHANSCETSTKSLELQTNELSEKVGVLRRSISEKEQCLAEAIDDKERGLSSLQSELEAQLALMQGLNFMRQNVDAFRVGEGVLEEPCGACMLPDGSVLVADTLKGLLLFSAQTELLRQVTSDAWKWPQGLCYDVDLGHILVSMVRRMADGAHRRVITFFDLQLEELRYIMGPEDETSLVTDNTAKERVALAPSQELYLTLCDKVGSFLYKCSAGEWTLLTQRQGASFVDCQVLAVIGPITEVLVTESRMGYVHMFSVRGANIVARKSMAIVEKPGALCVDERRQLFVQDVMSGKVRRVDTRTFEPSSDVCIVDDSVFSITASHGYLGVAVRDAKLVKIFRYDR